MTFLLPRLAATQADFDNLTALVQGALPLGTFTVATLPAPSAGIVNRLATVTDLFGNRTTRVRCEKVVVAGVEYFYWQPQSSDSSGTVDITSANVSLGALSMPTSLSVIGGLAGGIARSISFQDGAFPGQVKELRFTGALGALSTLNILGTGLGSGISLLTGGFQRYVSDWQVNPGTKVWVRLQ